VGQGKCKNKFEAGVHKPLKKTRDRVAIDISNGELSTVPRESSKDDNLHQALICNVKPLVKSKSSTDVAQQLLEKVQVSTGILHQAIKGSGVAIELDKYKQEEKWKPKQNASNRGMCLQILSFVFVATW
jgi:hypothetical protein